MLFPRQRHVTMSKEFCMLFDACEKVASDFGIVGY